MPDEVQVDGFWMDEHPVTNAEFRKFVKETGLCDRWPSARSTQSSTPTPIPNSRVWVSATPPNQSGPVDLNDYRNCGVMSPTPTGDDRGAGKGGGRLSMVGATTGRFTSP